MSQVFIQQLKAFQRISLIKYTAILGQVSFSDQAVIVTISVCFQDFENILRPCNMVIIQAAGLMMSSKRPLYMGNRVNGGVLRSSLIHRSNYTGDDFRK